MNKVGVVILNYKVKDQVLKCVESVKKSSYKDLEIIVVDNNSHDGLENSIKQFKDIFFIQTGDNLGYSGGNNQGIKKALDLDCEYIFILNPDTTIDSKCIEECLDGFKDEEAGIIGPKVYFGDGKTIWYAGGKFDLDNVLGSHLGVNEIDQGQYDQVMETDFVSGGALFVKSEVFKKIGLFDERYFLYYEDSDLCFRAKKVGYKIMYIPSAKVYHTNAQSTGLGSPLQDYFITRNRMLFASKFLPLKTKLALIREAIKNSKMPTRRMALKDFLLNNFGKGSFLRN